MAFATTLTRASFGAQPLHWTNLKLSSMTGVTVGAVTTVTLPAAYGGYALVGTIKQFLPFGSVNLNVTGVNKPSGILLLPAGSAVSG